VAIGVGSNLTKGAKTGDYDSIYETGLKYIEAVRRGREE
jgi:2-dehydro-3-deoxyphosphogluconate aldolase/(4S)-4-hydroxy-2-oxoglutarate aldolase